MRLLLDNNMSPLLAKFFRGVSVSHVRDFGWKDLVNGELVKAADSEFDFLITADKNMRFQTSLKGLNLGVIVLDCRNNEMETHREFVDPLLSRIDEFERGAFSVLTL